MGSVVAGVTANRCGQCGACDRTVVPVAMGDRETSDMEMTVEPFGYLVQSTTDRNPPHGWEVRMFSGRTVDGSIPFYLDGTVEYLRKEAERAWKEVDFISKERTEHLKWRTKLANDLDECERHRDALGIALNKAEAERDAYQATADHHYSEAFKLKAENERLREDAERYRWWAKNPYSNFQAAWKLWDAQSPWSTAIDSAKEKP